MVKFAAPVNHKHQGAEGTRNLSSLFTKRQFDGRETASDRPKARECLNEILRILRDINRVSGAEIGEEYEPESFFEETARLVAKAQKVL